MQRSSRLQAIARVQQHREHQQRAKLLEARQQLDKQRALLSQLETYRAEYLQLNAAPVDSQPSLNALINGSRFVRDLTHAIDQQREREQQFTELWQNENQYWQRLAARGEAMQGLVEQCREKEQRDLELAEDREAEDLWAATHTR